MKTVKILNDKPFDTDNRLMSTGLIIGLVLIGLFSFSALIGISGYADDIRNKNNGQAHALSNSAIGFVGLRTLLEETGQNVFLDPNEASNFAGYDFRLYTLTSAYQTDSLDELNTQSPKLIILPKWNVNPVPKSSGWVRKAPYVDVVNVESLASNLEAFAGDITLKQAEDKNAILAKEYQFTFNDSGAAYSSRFPRLQTMEGSRLEPVIVTPSGKIVLAKLKNTQSYILSDPDFLNTSGLKTRSGARFALDVLAEIANQNLTQRYVFDLSIHGIGGRRNMIKLFTQPPFLGTTVLLIALLILIAWQAFLRFGDPRRGTSEDFGEDFHMGPQSLTKTTAEFLAIAKLEPSVTPDYAALIRQQALTALHLTGQSKANRETTLDQREAKKSIQPAFGQLEIRAHSVTTRQEMLDVAKALQDWKKDIIS